MFWYRGAGPLLCLHLCLHLTCQATVTCFSGVYNEDVFSSLDWILDQASQRGLRIILPFEVCLRHPSREVLDVGNRLQPLSSSTVLNRPCTMP